MTRTHPGEETPEDTTSDPSRNDHDADWTDEGGATAEGPATDIVPE